MACLVAQHHRPTVHYLTTKTRPDDRRPTGKAGQTSDITAPAALRIKINNQQFTPTMSIRGSRLSLNPPIVLAVVRVSI
jgi:hypothetical protein